MVQVLWSTATLNGELGTNDNRRALGDVRMAERVQASVLALRDEIGRICQAVEVESPVSFFFVGKKFEIPLQAQPLPALPALVQLQQMLYELCYARRFDGKGRSAGQPAVAQDSGFVRRLIEANQSGERWDHEWQITGFDPSGQVAAVKNGAFRIFPPGEYCSPYGPGETVPSGMTVAVWLAKGSLSLQPGFYFAFGQTLGQEDDARSMLRLYWNVRAEGAPRLLAALTQRLNTFQVPFQLKTLTQPDQYAQRTDGSVLYVNRRFFPIVARLYIDLAPALADDLEADVPLFTKPLAPGLGLAEDPGTGDSFGLSRCRILAGALFMAHVRGAYTPQARLAEVEAHFSSHGLTLDRPYLNPGSTDRYELPQGNDGP